MSFVTNSAIIDCT